MLTKRTLYRMQLNKVGKAIYFTRYSAIYVYSLPANDIDCVANGRANNKINSQLKILHRIKRGHRQFDFACFDFFRKQK